MLCIIIVFQLLILVLHLGPFLVAGSRISSCWLVSLVYSSTHHVRTFYVCFPRTPEASPLQAFLSMTRYLDLCSACAVTVVIFGHLIPSFCLVTVLTYLLMQSWFFAYYNHIIFSEQYSQSVSIVCYAEPCTSYRQHVCLFDRLSRADIVSKRHKLGSQSRHRQIAGE